MELMNALDLDASSLHLTDPLLGILQSKITRLNSGTFTIIESNKLNDIHRALHWLLMDAIRLGMHIHLVDVANMFNPHVLSVTDHNGNLNDIVGNISLARPFQYHQSINIMRTLIRNTLYHGGINQLIVVTSMDSQLVENEDMLEVIKQIQYILSGLQNIALRGNTVLMTNNIRPTYHNLFTAHAHTHIIVDDDVNLLKHPFIPA